MSRPGIGPWSPGPLANTFLKKSFTLTFQNNQYIYLFSPLSSAIFQATIKSLFPEHLQVTQCQITTFHTFDHSCCLIYKLHMLFINLLYFCLKIKHSLCHLCQTQNKLFGLPNIFYCHCFCQVVLMAHQLPIDFFICL